ncbi:CaiB/BaiF CoA transferase family protein [Ramlibacter henchirensis]|nr:CoA transferase [Ramlibacter henchirensis]
MNSSDASQAPREKPPLDGLVIADFSHFIAGPYATMVLGDLGAKVIKVESTEGDAFRAFPPFVEGEGVPYLWGNRNKLGVTLDLKSQAGRAVAVDLVRKADVLVENFSTGVMQRFGLGWPEMSELNPRLVYCSISAYGREGPHAHRLGFDSVVQAESGFMSMTGFPDQQPTRAGPSVMDLGTAMMAANAIQAALHARYRTGRGQKVEVSLFGMAVQMLGYFNTTYLATGRIPHRAGNSQVTAAPIGYFDTADKPIYITCANDRTFQRLMVQAFERPDLAAHPDFSTNAERVKHQPRLLAVMQEIFIAQPQEHWLQKLQAAGVPSGAVRTVGEAMTSSEVEHLGLVETISHPTLGSIPNVKLPVTLSDTPLAAARAAPVLGSDTTAVLTDVLGYSGDRIAAARAAGAFVAAEQGPFAAESGATRS